MKYFLLLLILGTFAEASPNQRSCKYWLEYFDRISNWEKAKLLAIKRHDHRKASYYSDLIKRDMADVTDDGEASLGTSLPD